MLPDDDDLIPVFSIADLPVAEDGAASAEPAGEDTAALPALDIAELIPDFTEGSESGEAVDLSALFAEDAEGGGARVEIAEVPAGADAGDSFAVTFPAALPGLDDIPGDGGIV